MLSGNQRLESDSIRNDQSRSFLLDEALLPESRHQARDGLARRSNHLSNFFMSEGNLHPFGMLAASLIEPTHQQAGKFFGCGTGEHEGANFTASGVVIGTEQLRDPEGQLSMHAHHAQHVTLPDESYVAGLLGFRGRFIFGAANGGCNAQGAPARAMRRIKVRPSLAQTETFTSPRCTT